MVQTFNVFSSQPVSVTGKKTGGTFTIDNGLTEFNINETGTIFRLRCNDNYYMQPGGLVQLDSTGSLVYYIASAVNTAIFTPGTILTQVVAKFRKYGVNGVVGSSFETVTIARIDIESRDKTEDNGRQARQVNFVITSTDGVTSPIVYSY